MTKLAAVIFDVDGTLADTEKDGHRVAFNQAFEQAKLDWDWTVDIYGELLKVTGGKERIKHYLAHFLTDFQVQGDLDEFVAGLHQQKTHFYKKLLSEGKIPLRTGVKRLLDELREKNIRLAIATTTTPVNVEYLISNALSKEALDWFEVIAAGDIVPAKKPAPDIFSYAMQKMGLEPDACIAFEDSRNGFLSARDSGIKDIVVTINGYTKNDDFTGASLVVDDLGDVNVDSLLQLKT